MLQFVLTIHFFALIISAFSWQHALAFVLSYQQGTKLVSLSRQGAPHQSTNDDLYIFLLTLL
jgi:hypothetical protein